MKKLFLLIFPLILLNSCSSKSEKRLLKKELKQRFSCSAIYKDYVFTSQQEQENALKNYIEQMPLEYRIAQLFIENLEGNKTFRSYEKFSDITGNSEDSNPLIAGGYLFFSFNLSDTVEETSSFIFSIRNYTSENLQIQPFLAIDQEGGYVNRLRKLTGGLQSEEKIASSGNVLNAYEIYSRQAQKMKAIGFDMNLAPVVEVCTQDNKDFLDGRSFGDADAVEAFGTACVNAYENNGIAAVVKHFPGNTNTDPHTGLPEIKLEKDELEDLLESFRYITEHNPSGVLMSHARTAAIDSKTPACLSKIWVTDILRNEYGYKGIIFSDDIFMGALAYNGFPPEKAAVFAIEAGIDCIMTSEKRFAKQARVLYQKAKTDAEFEKRVNESVYRILDYKIKTGLFNL